MILQEQECVFLCVEGGVNEDEAKLEAPTLLPAVRPSWAFIPWPLQSPHPDSWILLTPSGDFQYGYRCPWRFHTSLGSSQTYEQDSQDVVCREGNPGNHTQGAAWQ